MSKVKFLDLKSAYIELRSELDFAYKQVLESGHYVLGSHLQSFENQFAEFCQSPYCIGVSNGLDALVLTLKALDIGPGDEVIVPANTFIATWIAVSLVGATPIPAQPDAKTHNLSGEGLRPTITSKTRAIIPVHLYGAPAEMDSIIEVAREHNLFVIEDAAQAHGAKYKNRRTGSIGDAATFSFYPGKNLGAFGDGGAITTSDANLYDKLLYFRNYGSKLKYHHEYIGHNCRLDELQAAFLSVKLQKLDEWNLRRKKIATLYQNKMQNPAVILPKYPDYCESAWHLFVVETDRRSQLQEHLHASGIETHIHYPLPPAKQKAYLDKTVSSLCNYTNHDRLLSLPIGPHLSESDALKVVDAVQKF